MNTAELLINDRTFDNLMFFITCIRISETGSTETARASANNLADSWETMLLNDGFSLHQLIKIRQAVR